MRGGPLVAERPGRLQPALHDPRPWVDALRRREGRLGRLREPQHLRPASALGRDARPLVDGVDVHGLEPAVLRPVDQAGDHGIGLVVRGEQALQPCLDRRVERHDVVGLATDQPPTLELLDGRADIADAGELG
ncbi:MAG TPA: hypothetical protein VHH55_08220 [Gaiellaceae bacterium]|nr:hypothetical protein [Gaiellaceae bacterium]